MNDLEDRFIDALIQGNYDPFIRLLDNGSDKIELAAIGQKSGPRKTLRAERQDVDVLSFQTWDDNSNHLRGERPMLAEHEFRVSFGLDSNNDAEYDSSLTGDERKTLFRDGDIKVLVEE
jgi:hypothetical protein